ncbi:hypothetical protein C8Q79DRAFT_927516 [Trametes meyenii]|nr:hypothetical protein C8Q79DRAFT_927516 [Trametes meyenii]
MCQQSTAEPASCHFRRGQITKKAPRWPGMILSEGGDMIWGDKGQGNQGPDGAVANVDSWIAWFPEVPGSISGMGSLKRESCDGKKSAGWHDSSAFMKRLLEYFSQEDQCSAFSYPLISSKFRACGSRFVWRDLVKNWVYSERITAEAATFPLLLDYLCRYLTKVVHVIYRSKAADYAYLLVQLPCVYLQY